MFLPWNQKARFGCQLNAAVIQVIVWTISPHDATFSLFFHCWEKITKPHRYVSLQILHCGPAGTFNTVWNFGIFILEIPIQWLPNLATYRGPLGSLLKTEAPILSWTYRVRVSENGAGESFCLTPSLGGSWWGQPFPGLWVPLGTHPQRTTLLIPSHVCQFPVLTFPLENDWVLSFTPKLRPLRKYPLYSLLFTSEA